MHVKYYHIIFYFLVSNVFAQSNHTILTYNLLNYDDEDDRESYYQLIINEIQPDILVCQEVNADIGFDHFLCDVLMSFVVVNVILHITRYLFAKWEKTKA